MSQSPAEPPQVLILSADVGAGHKQAARAVVEALEEARPGLAVRVEDVMSHVSRLFRLYYQGGFILGMTRLPWAYGLGFRVTNRPDTPRRTLGERFRLARDRFHLRRLTELVLRWQPPVIVCTHFLAAPLLGRLKAQGRLRSRLAVVVTDHYAHRWWLAENIDRWFVPDEESRDRLVRWGVAAETIRTCDVPIRLKWTQPIDRARARADWNLPADAPVVLLAGGAEFTCGPIEDIAQGILDACPTAHVAVLAGRNKDLLARLSRMSEAGRHLTPVSFTDRAHELVAAASLMVTKPGGVTTAECCASGTPMVLLKPVPGQEGANADYLSAKGAAVVPGAPAQVIETVRQLLADPAELAAMAARAKALHRPAARPIAAQVVEWLAT